MSSVPRLHVPASLAAGGAVRLRPDQVRYLFRVMRLKTGADVRVFNARDGEWRARTDAGSHDLTVTDQIRPGSSKPALPAVDLWFSPIRAARTEFLVEKATELGVRTLQPVTTRRTRPGTLNIARLSRIIEEASEQTGRLTLPALRPCTNLHACLREHQPYRLIFCDEEMDAKIPLADLLRDSTGAADDAMLIGPEGGFDPEERAFLRTTAVAVGLGPRILRAETAALSALSLWQAHRGERTHTNGAATVSIRA